MSVWLLDFQVLIAGAPIGRRLGEDDGPAPKAVVAGTADVQSAWKFDFLSNVHLHFYNGFAPVGIQGNQVLVAFFNGENPIEWMIEFGSRPATWVIRDPQSKLVWEADPGTINQPIMLQSYEQGKAAQEFTLNPI